MPVGDQQPFGLPMTATNPHRYWSPPGRARLPGNTAGQIPEPGALIAMVVTRQAWRVVDVVDVHQANWADQTQAVWEKAGRPDPATWDGRERRVLAEPPRNPASNGEDRRGLSLSPWWPEEQWVPLTDPYPVCVECGLLWPCPCDDRNKAAAEAMAEFDRLGGIMPGCCWACNEPVTGRHHSIVFDGDNLLLPGGGPAAFHTSYSRKAARGPSGNQTCRGEAEAYEDRWVAAGEGRRVRLRCPGVEFRHYGGVAECTEGDACPGPTATHRSADHCTTQVRPGSWHFQPAEAIKPDEIRPRTNCGGKGCRGPKPADVAAQSPADDATRRTRPRTGGTNPPDD